MTIASMRKYKLFGISLFDLDNISSWNDNYIFNNVVLALQTIEMVEFRNSSYPIDYTNGDIVPYYIWCKYKN